jgi:transcriptional regulator with XRE-family HTH domain
MNVGIAVKTIRKKLDFTQSQLADACKISQATLSQIEAGKKRPNDQTLKRICKCLEIPEAIIYIIAMEEGDVPASKKGVYQLIHPSMVSLSLEVINSKLNTLEAATAELVPTELATAV